MAEMLISQGLRDDIKYNERQIGELRQENEEAWIIVNELDKELETMLKYINANMDNLGDIKPKSGKKPQKHIGKKPSALTLGKKEQKASADYDQEHYPSDLETIFENCQDLEAKMNSRIIGQEDHIKKLCEFIPGHYGLLRKDKALGFYLHGPTSVGKTLTGLVLAEELFKSTSSLRPFFLMNGEDMAEKHEALKIIGAPPSYVGWDDFEHGSAFFDHLARNPMFSVIVVDEIEKAHARVMQFLMKSFRQGYFTSPLGKEYSTAGHIFIFTSNIGEQEYRLKNDSIGFSEDGVVDVRKERVSFLDKIIKERTTPEFRARMSGFLHFNEPFP